MRLMRAQEPREPGDARVSGTPSVLALRGLSRLLRPQTSRPSPGTSTPLREPHVVGVGSSAPLFPHLFPENHLLMRLLAEAEAKESSPFQLGAVCFAKWGAAVPS